MLCDILAPIVVLGKLLQLLQQITYKAHPNATSVCQAHQLKAVPIGRHRPAANMEYVSTHDASPVALAMYRAIRSQTAVRPASLRKFGVIH